MIFKDLLFRIQPLSGSFYGSNKSVGRISLSAKSCKHPLTRGLFVYASRGRQKKAGRETTKTKRGKEKINEGENCERSVQLCE